MHDKGRAIFMRYRHLGFEPADLLQGGVVCERSVAYGEGLAE